MWAPQTLIPKGGGRRARLLSLLIPGREARRISHVVGNFLVSVGVLGLLSVGVTTLADQLAGPSSGLARAAAIPSPTDLRDEEGAIGFATPARLVSAEAGEPITRLRLPRIRLDTQVVPAPYVEGDGGTWEIPPFVASHAERTAGAGQRGNAVIFGHVTSRAMGNVFHELSRARVGDTVQVSGTDRDFIYEVTDVRSVPRTDVSVLDATPTPTLTLITCTGLWLPFIYDYAERLIVRAELTPAVELSPRGVQVCSDGQRCQPSPLGNQFARL